MAVKYKCPKCHAWATYNGYCEGCDHEWIRGQKKVVDKEKKPTFWQKLWS